MTTFTALQTFEFSDLDFEKIAQIAFDEYGLHIGKGKKSLVYSRLVGRLRNLGLSDFSEYCSFLDGPSSRDEKLRLLSSLTTNVTRFFREEHHFKTLTNAAIPAALSRNNDGEEPVRIWSAGCSTGQEPYSIAISILEKYPGISDQKIRILATDIDPDVLMKAQDGVYTKEELAGVEFRVLDRYFREKSNGSFEAGCELKNLITFRKLNLIQDWPMRKRFDMIFCRNVAIYFDEATQSRLWERLSEQMHEGGYISIGHSERISGPAASSMSSLKNTTYRKLISNTLTMQTESSDES